MAGFSTLTERIDTGARLTVPYFLMAVLFVFNIVAVSYPLNGIIKAPLFLMCVYYWSIYRPTLIPPWLSFLSGAVMDLLSGLPVGINALVFVAVQWSVTDQRRFLMGQSFVMIWFGFTVLSLMTALVQWGMFGLIHQQWLSLKPVWTSCILGVALFPLVCVMLHLTHKILPAPPASMRLRSQK